MAIDHRPNSRGKTAVNTSIGFLCVAAFFVLTRCFARFGILKTWGSDDLVIICALALSLALTALIAQEEQHGMGRHFNTLLPGEYEEMSKAFWASVIVYNAGMTVTKASILLQFLRFFVGRTVRRASWILFTVVCIYGTWTFIGSIITCLPVAYFWDKSIKGGRCLNEMAFWFSNATFNIITDIMICVLPIPVLKDLQLPKKQKYALILVFVMGGFGCITSILRLHSLYVISRSTDITWDNVGAATWSSVELNTGITCACLPTLRPLIVHLFPRLLHSTKRRSTVEMIGGPYVRHSRGRDAEANTADEDLLNSRENSWAAVPGRDPAGLPAMKNVNNWPLSPLSMAHNSEHNEKHISRFSVAKTFDG